MCLIVGLRPLIIIFYYNFIVLKDIQQHWDQKSLYWIECGQCSLEWRGCAWIGWVYANLALWLQRVSPKLFLGLSNLIRYGMKFFNNQVPESENGNTVQMISASVELCETEVCVSCTSNLLAQTCDLQKYTRPLPILTLNSQGLLIKSASWNNPSLQCFLVSLLPDHVNQSGGFFDNIVNLVKPIHAYDNSFLSIHVPIVIVLLLQDASVVLVMSIYFSGTRNDSSLDMKSLTLGSTWWWKVKSLETDQKITFGLCLFPTCQYCRYSLVCWT